MIAAKYNIKAHLKHLKEFIKEAEDYKSVVDRKRFLSDKMMQDAICRSLQQIIEAMLTIGNMLIAEYGWKKPEKNEDIFEILAEEKVYSKTFAKKLRGLGGFRNILVHDYIDLDLKIVYKNLEKGIPIFKKYAQHIAKFIS